MNYKSYIAILFAIVFFGKFLVMDSKLLVVILDADEIAYINPFCKKQNAKIDGKDFQKSFNADSNHLNIIMDSFCNAPFKFEVYNWEYRILSEESRAYAYHTPSLPQSNLDRFYPPPRV